MRFENFPLESVMAINILVYDIALPSDRRLERDEVFIFECKVCGALKLLNLC